MNLNGAVYSKVTTLQYHTIQDDKAKDATVKWAVYNMLKLEITLP